VRNSLAVVLLLTAATLNSQQPAAQTRIASSVPPPPTIRGFGPPAALEQYKLELQYKSLISADEARKFHRHFTAEPHPAGSERNNELARWIADKWKEQGLEDIKLHRYDVLTSYPKEVSLEMVAPISYKALLREQPIDVDPDTKNPNVLGAYTSMSASGEVTAPIVYAHSGNPEDYDLLRKRGISVQGKVVLVRWWTEGCHFCRATLPVIEQLRRDDRLAHVPVVVITAFNRDLGTAASLPILRKPIELGDLLSVTNSYGCVG